MKEVYALLSTILALLSSSAGQTTFLGSSIVTNGNSNDQVIIINGQQIDLNSSTVLEQNDQYTKYQPEGFPNVVITKYHNGGGVSVVSTGGNTNVQIGSGNAKEIMEAVDRTLAQVNANVNRLQEDLQFRLSNMFNKPGWPFN